MIKIGVKYLKNSRIELLKFVGLKYCFNFAININIKNNMETTNTIRIPNPSKELVAFIEKAQQQKKERMKEICDKYRKLVNG